MTYLLIERFDHRTPLFKTLSDNSETFISETDIIM